MYTVINEKAFITGDIGRYDNLIKNNSVRYARNSVDSFKRYLSCYTLPQTDLRFDVTHFSKGKTGLLDKVINFFKDMKFDKKTSTLEADTEKLVEAEKRRTPIDFVQKYMPYTEDSHIVDTMALMGAAFEEMGKSRLSVEELNEKNFKDNPFLTSEALDINQDGTIDLAEYSTSILLEDALSADTDKLSHENINGVITKDGATKAVGYFAKHNVEGARNVFSQIYDYYNLDEAQKEFSQDDNNRLLNIVYK